MYEHKMRKVNQNLQDYSQMVLLTSISNLILKQTEKKNLVFFNLFRVSEKDVSVKVATLT